MLASFCINCGDLLEGVYIKFSPCSHLSPVHPDEQPPWQTPLIWSHDPWFRQFPHWREHVLPYLPEEHSSNKVHKRSNRRLSLKKCHSTFHRIIILTYANIFQYMNFLKIKFIWGSHELHCNKVAKQNHFFLTLLLIV